jgi:DnaJ-class molecular chaperone
MDPIVFRQPNCVIPLDRPCEPCKGTGRYSDWHGGSCGNCNGSGFELTEVGEALLAFFERHCIPRVRLS